MHLKNIYENYGSSDKGVLIIFKIRFPKQLPDPHILPNFKQ